MAEIQELAMAALFIGGLIAFILCILFSVNIMTSLGIGATAALVTFVVLLVA